MSSDSSKEELIAKADYEKLAKAVSDLTTQLATAQVEIAKAQAEATAQREAREQEGYFEKARALSALPVAAAELGHKLWRLAKQDPESALYFESLLKTADNMLTDFGIYAARGRAQADASDPVVKASLASDPVAALLALDRDAAARYVAKRQAEVRGR